MGRGVEKIWVTNHISFDFKIHPQPRHLSQIPLLSSRSSCRHLWPGLQQSKQPTKIQIPALPCSQIPCNSPSALERKSKSFQWSISPPWSVSSPPRPHIFHFTSHLLSRLSTHPLPDRPPCYSLNMPSTLLPQSLHTCYSLSVTCFSFTIYKAHCFASFWPFLNVKHFPTHPLQMSNPHSHQSLPSLHSWIFLHSTCHHLPCHITTVYYLSSHTGM